MTKSNTSNKLIVEEYYIKIIIKGSIQRILHLHNNLDKEIYDDIKYENVITTYRELKYYDEIKTFLNENTKG